MNEEKQETRTEAEPACEDDDDLAKWKYREAQWIEHQVHIITVGETFHPHPHCH